MSSDILNGEIRFRGRLLAVELTDYHPESTFRVIRGKRLEATRETRLAVGRAFLNAMKGKRKPLTNYYKWSPGDGWPE